MSSKIFAVVAAALTISACGNFDVAKYATADSNASAKTRLRACLISEANTKFQNGTLFAAGITETANTLANTCLQKLALQSAGIDNEAQSTASTIIQNLKNYGSAQ